MQIESCKQTNEMSLDAIETLGSEIDPEFNGYYQVNQVSY